MSPCPPPKRSRKSCWKCPRTVCSVSANSRRLSVLILSMIFSSGGLGGGQVLVLLGKGLVADLQGLEFLEGFEVDAADGVDLAPQLVDLLLYHLALVLLLGIGGLAVGGGQVDAVILAEPLDQGVALDADLVGGQVLDVEAFLDFADLAPQPLGLGGQFGPLLLEQLALVDVLDGLAGERLLAEIKLGNLRFRPQDVPSRGLGSAEAVGQLPAGRRRWRGRAPAGLPRPAAAGRAGCGAVLRSWPARLSFPWFRGCGPAAGPPGRRSARPGRPGGLPSRPARHRAVPVAAGPRPGGPTTFHVAPRRRGTRPPASPAAGRTGRGALRRPRSSGVVRPGRPAPGGVRPRSAPGAARCWAIRCWRPARAVRPWSILPSNSPNWPFRARSWLRREIRPAASCRGPTVSVPSASSNSPARVTKLSPAPAERAKSRAWLSFSTIQVRPSSRRARAASRGSVSTKRSARPSTPGRPWRSTSGRGVGGDGASSHKKPTRPLNRCDCPCK